MELRNILLEKLKKNKPDVRKRKLRNLLISEKELLELLENDPDEFYQYELTNEFIIKHKDKLNWDIICYIKKDFSKKIFEECAEFLRWDLIDMKLYEFIDDKIIDKHKDIISWDKICLHPYFDINILDKFNEYLNWEYVSLREDITEEFVIKYSDKLNWYSLLMANDFTIDFLKKYKKYIKEDYYTVVPNDFRDELFDDN